MTIKVVKNSFYKYLGNTPHKVVGVPLKNIRIYSKDWSGLAELERSCVSDSLQKYTCTENFRCLNSRSFQGWEMLPDQKSLIKTQK